MKKEKLTKSEDLATVEHTRQLLHLLQEFLKGRASDEDCSLSSADHTGRSVSGEKQKSI